MSTNPRELPVIVSALAWWLKPPGCCSVRTGCSSTLAVCTAATPENMKLAFARFPIDRWVETVVSPADGLRGKPHPDIFLEAARRLGLAPARCIVFVDAPLGIEGARRAGMGAVALTTTLPLSAFSSYPNLLASAADFRTLAPSALTKEDHHA